MYIYVYTFICLPRDTTIMWWCETMTHSCVNDTPPVAACCSVLQCATHCGSGRCSVLQCIAVCCSVLQCVAVCCSVLQCVAVCCGVLRCVAVCCGVAIHTCCSVL